MNDLQKHLLKMLKTVVSACDDNGIQYHAIAGTCLGALLHRGFIPWDDDIDLAMPREDYDRFIALADKILPENLKIFGPCDAKHNDCLSIKIHDINTTCIQENMSHFPDRYTGVYIDVIPLDGFPNPGLRRVFHILRVKFFGFVNIALRFFPDIVFKTGKKEYTHFGGCFKAYERAVKKYSYDESEYTCYNNDLRAFTTRIIDIKNIGKTKKLAFEDTEINVPEKTENYLHGLYGEYKAFPPENKRITHDLLVLDLEKPYTYYAEKVRLGEKL